MADLIKILESFNRKESYFLLAQALGNPKFRLSRNFRLMLGKELGFDKEGFEIPPDAFVGMEYHLNWVHASLVLKYCNEVDDAVNHLRNGAATGSKEDVDLLIAFPDDDGRRYHLIFIEAKGYETDGFAPFIKKQLVSKIKRLKKILGPNGTLFPNVESYVCLMSGYEPLNLNDKNWPTWRGHPLKWLELPLPCERYFVNYDPSIIRMNYVGNVRTFQCKKVVPRKPQ